MTWSARFKVTEVGAGPAPIDVRAVASVEDGSLVQNTEQATVMELHVQVNADETSLAVGDEITGSGHFQS